MSSTSSARSAEDDSDLEEKLEAVIEHDEGKAVEMAEALLEGLRGSS